MRVVQIRGELIEPAPAPEIFCNRLGRIELVGDGWGCFVVYRHSVVPSGHDTERIVTGRIYAPLAAIPPAMELMQSALAEADPAVVARAAARGWVS